MESGHFRDPGAGGVHGAKYRPVTKVLGCLQQELDFRGAQNHREFLFVARQRDAVDADGKMQRVGVEKPESANRLNIGRQRDLFLLDQVQLIFPDLFRSEQIGRFAEVFGELSDAANVSGDGSGGVVANLEVLQHSFSQWGHNENSFRC